MLLPVQNQKSGYNQNNDIISKPLPLLTTPPPQRPAALRKDRLTKPTPSRLQQKWNQLPPPFRAPCLKQLVLTLLTTLRLVIIIIIIDMCL